MMIVLLITTRPLGVDLLETVTFSTRPPVVPPGGSGVLVVVVGVLIAALHSKLVLVGGELSAAPAWGLVLLGYRVGLCFLA